MSKRKQIIGFIALEIAMFIGTLDSTIINIALPDIMNYFKASLNDTSWISTIYVLGLSVFMIPASKLADQFGRKKVMLIGLLLFGGSSALCGFSNSLIFLIIMRFTQGIGGAIITPIVIPMALEIFGNEKTQTVAGAIGAVTAIAAAGGPPIGGLLIKYINWQSIFFVNIPFALISFVLTIIFIKESYDKSVSKKIDWFGMLFLTITLFMLTFALLKGRDYGWSSILIISMFIISAISLVLFILTELKVKTPLVELHLFKEYTFTASCICYLITGFGIVSPLLIFNYFLQNALGYEALKAAYIVMAVSLTVIISMPLGSAVAGKLSAKPINFLGVLFMSAGAFMLSKLTFSTPKSTMILYMIIMGVGLGFSCQSLVSSIKHLPKEKSGIGSGIVNASRQVGTCLGIALLVSVLNTNVTAAKNGIKNEAANIINKANIASPIKNVMIKDIKENINCSNNTSDNQKKLENKLESDIKDTLTSLSNVSQPSSNSTLEKLYNGSDTVSNSAVKIYKGQKSLSNGIKTLSSGLSRLQSGSTTLISGLSGLDGGISKVLAGTQTLNSAGSKGIVKMTSGIQKLNDGAQRLYTQFSSGKESGKQTIYDGVTGIAEGAQSLSSNLNSYVSAVNNTCYLMIKSNPASPILLIGYKSKLKQAQAAYSATDKSSKKQYELQIKALNNIIALYTAGTDSSVKNEQQFEAKLSSLSLQDKSSQNVVTSGSKIASGANLMSNASKKVSAQFLNDGTFKNGIKQIVNGIFQLNHNSGKLVLLKSGTNKLTGALLKLKSGSGKLLEGSQKLKSGLTSAKNGSNKLLSGSMKLADANQKISDGASRLTSGVGVVGQTLEIKDAVSKIKSNKENEIADAFDHTFLLSSIILALASICGLFTDKKIPNKE